jgi:hypothetical protein
MVVYLEDVLSPGKIDSRKLAQPKRDGYGRVRLASGRSEAVSESQDPYQAFYGWTQQATA